MPLNFINSLDYDLLRAEIYDISAIHFLPTLSRLMTESLLDTYEPGYDMDHFFQTRLVQCQELRSLRFGRIEFWICQGFNINSFRENFTNSREIRIILQLKSPELRSDFFLFGQFELL
jgi:hypothetical protein